MQNRSVLKESNHLPRTNSKPKNPVEAGKARRLIKDIILSNTSTRLLNLSLHGATLVTRFLFIFFLAKYLAPSDIGYFGLFTATVGYSLYFVGLDFYTYVTREMIKTPLSGRGRLLKGQAALSGILYFFFLPVAYALLYQYSNWSAQLLIWFLPILILEHFNQEMSRLLVALSQQITSSVVLFIRQGSWSLAAVAMMQIDESSRQLGTVMALWTVSGFGAALVAVRKLHKLGVGGWQEPLDWAWVRRGIGVSAAFLLATLALRGMQTFDRYWLETLGGIEIVGAYVLFIGVAGSLLAFLDAGVFSFTYPMLIKLNEEKKFALAREKVRVMLWVTVLLTTVFSLLSWLALPYLLYWIGKETYIAAMDLYPWLLLATILNAIGMVPHFALYAAGQDRPIIKSHIAALVTFGFSVLALSGPSGPFAVPQALIVSFLLILLWKSGAYWRHLLAIAEQKPVLQSN